MYPWADPKAFALPVRYLLSPLNARSCYKSSLKLVHLNSVFFSTFDTGGLPLRKRFGYTFSFHLNPCRRLDVTGKRLGF